MRMKPVRVLYVHFNSELSGSDVSLLNLIRCLDKERFTPYVVLPSPGPLVQGFRDAGACILFVAQPKIWRSVRSVISYTIGFVPSVFHIRELIIRHEIDVVHTNTFLNLYGPLAAKLTRRPHIHHIRKYQLGPRLIQWAVATAVLKLSKFVVPVSRAVKERLYGPSPDTRIQIVYNGVDVVRYQHRNTDRERIRRRFHIPLDAQVIGCVSNLDRRKGQDVLVQAMTQLWPRFPSLYCLLVGRANDSYAATLRKLVNERNVEGRLIIALPSLTEAFPRAALEAMACGKPVVASKVGGIPEMIEDGRSGLLVAPGNPAELAAAIELLIAEPKYASQLGREAASRARRLFNVVDHARQIEDLYLRCLRGRGSL